MTESLRNTVLLQGGELVYAVIDDAGAPVAYYLHMPDGPASLVHHLRDDPGGPTRLSELRACLAIALTAVEDDMEARGMFARITPSGTPGP